MKLVNPDLLAEFRLGRCEWCNAVAADAHHVFPKGMGGGGRLDIRCNLVSLCRECHTSHHAGNGPRTRAETPDPCLLALVAAREDVQQRDIEAVVWLFRRLPKESDEYDFRREVRELHAAARELARREWDEWQKQYWPETLKGA